MYTRASRLGKSAACAELHSNSDAAISAKHLNPAILVWVPLAGMRQR